MLEAQIFAGNPRFSQNTAETCRFSQKPVTVPFSLSLLIPPYMCLFL